VNKSDNVNSPSHYNTGKFEVIDIIEDRLTDEELEGYYMGNVLKYICRYKYKNGMEDLKKAVWYINRLIKRKENKHGLEVR